MQLLLHIIHVTRNTMFQNNHVNNLRTWIWQIAVSTLNMSIRKNAFSRIEVYFLHQNSIKNLSHPSQWIRYNLSLTIAEGKKKTSRQKHKIPHFVVREHQVMLARAARSVSKISLMQNSCKFLYICFHFRLYCMDFSRSSFNLSNSTSLAVAVPCC